MYDVKATKYTQTPEQIRSAQKATAEGKTVPAVIEAVAPPVVSNGNGAVQSYLDEIAPPVLRRVKFDKEGKYTVADTGDSISEETDLIAIYDQTWAGYIKFNGAGQPPSRCGGQIYKGYSLPPRAELGDTDQEYWEAGMDGRKQDPWLHQIVLVLQNPETGDLFAFTTSSITGRRAVGTLLHQCAKLPPDVYPIVRLKVGGFAHRDSRVGWVKTPAIAVVGRAPREGAARPDSSLTADLNDQIPF